MIVEVRKLRRLFYSLLTGTLLAYGLPIYPTLDKLEWMAHGETTAHTAYRWSTTRLPYFLGDYASMSPEQSPGPLLALNLTIALVLGGLAAYLAYKLLSILRLPNL